ncbi:MAG: hypothetical protein KA354_19660 [Phycisphaerae bacterium]|nr:hypothetical protein [Phycisphaerae bacterium]
MDKKTEAMLAVANTLTADDLDCLRGVASVATVDPPDEETETTTPAVPDDVDPTGSDDETEVDEGSSLAPEQPRARRKGPRHAVPTPASLSAGEYERQRTRESKVSTGCLGKQREGHDWWPLGTELVGRIGSEQFTAVVIENPQVKSGRSLRIASGAAAGRVCITPTRAAIEATEDYRQALKLGRGGGITNGWEFWRPAKH